MLLFAKVKTTALLLQYLGPLQINFPNLLVFYDTQITCNWNQTHNHLVRKRTLNHLAKLASSAKWLSVRLRTKWLWLRFQLPSINLQISRLFQARSSWHSGNYRVWIHSKTRTWHDKNNQPDHLLVHVYDFKLWKEILYN